MNRRWVKQTLGLLLALSLGVGDLSGAIITEAAERTRAVQAMDQGTVQTADQEPEQIIVDPSIEEQSVQTMDQEQVIEEEPTQTTEVQQVEEPEQTTGTADINFEFGALNVSRFSTNAINYTVSIRWNVEAKDSTKGMDAPVRYDVYRSTSPKKNYKKLTSTSYAGFTDKSKEKGFYYYKIKAVFQIDGKETYVSHVYVIQYIQPKAELTNEGLDQNGKQELSWNCPGRRESTVHIDKQRCGIATTGFRVYRSRKRDSGYQQIADVAHMKYADSTAISGATYFYKVRPYAYDPASGKYAYGLISDAFEVKVTCRGNVSFTGRADSATQISLSWKKKSSYNVYEIFYKSEEQYGYERLGSYTGSGCKVKQLDKNTTYKFYLRPGKKVNGKIKYYGLKKWAEVKTGFGTFTNVKIKNKEQSYENGIFTQNFTISWDKMVGAKSYNLYKKNNNGNYDLVGSTTGTSMSVEMMCTADRSDNGSVRLEAIDKDGNVSFVNFQRVEMQVKNSSGTYDSEYVYLRPQLRIEHFKMQRTGSNSLQLNWDKVLGAGSLCVAVSSQETGECSDGENYYLSGDATSYVINDLKPGKHYYITLSASNSRLSSILGAVERVQYEQPVKKASISGKHSGKGKVSLTIRDDNTGTKQYVIYRSTKKASGYKMIKTISAKNESTTYTDTKCKKGQTYYYKVKTVITSSAGQRAVSKSSNIIAVKIKK